MLVYVVIHHPSHATPHVLGARFSEGEAQGIARSHARMRKDNLINTWTRVQDGRGPHQVAWVAASEHSGGHYRIEAHPAGHILLP